MHYIDQDLFFTFRAVKRKIEHHRVRIHFCPSFSIADWAMNPPGFSLIFVNHGISLSVFALRYSSGVLLTFMCHGISPVACRIIQKDTDSKTVLQLLQPVPV